jgi:hypothetical protein
MKAILWGFALAQACALASAQSAQAGAATYRCGGIGVDEQQQMKADAGRHDLMLSFATPRGAYVADVDVEIRQGTRTLVQAHCNGPLMLVDLAGQGAYQVTAKANGQTLRKSVTLAGKPARLAFTWPAS